MERHLREKRPGGMTVEEKIRSWNKLEANLTLQPSPFSFFAFLMRIKNRVTAGFLIILLLGGGTATAYADNAKPGDLLFPVEIAKEKVQIALTPSAQKKEELRVRFAEKRLKEVRELESLVNPDDQGGQRDEGTAGTTTTVATENMRPTHSRDEEEKVARIKRGADVALNELNATRDKLRENGNENATRAVDDIINEVSEVAKHPRKSDRHDDGEANADAATSTAQEGEAPGDAVRASTDVRAKEPESRGETKKNTQREVETHDKTGPGNKQEPGVTTEAQAPTQQNHDPSERPESRD